MIPKSLPPDLIRGWEPGTNFWKRSCAYKHDPEKCEAVFGSGHAQEELAVIKSSLKLTANWRAPSSPQAQAFLIPLPPTSSIIDAFCPRRLLSSAPAAGPIPFHILLVCRLRLSGRQCGKPLSHIPIHLKVLVIDRVVPIAAPTHKSIIGEHVDHRFRHPGANFPGTINEPVRVRHPGRRPIYQT